MDFRRIVYRPPINPNKRHRDCQHLDLRCASKDGGPGFAKNQLRLCKQKTGYVMLIAELIDLVHKIVVQVGYSVGQKYGHRNHDDADNDLF